MLGVFTFVRRYTGMRHYSKVCCVQILAYYSIIINFFDYSLMWLVIIAYALLYFSMAYIPRGLTDRLMFFTIANMQDGVICLDAGKINAFMPIRCQELQDYQ